MKKGGIPLSVSANILFLAVLLAGLFHLSQGISLAVFVPTFDRATLLAAILQLGEIPGWSLLPEGPIMPVYKTPAPPRISPTPSPIPASAREPSNFSTVETKTTDGAATVIAVSPKIFKYAHAMVAADDRFYIGMANRVGNNFATNQVIVFTDPTDLNQYLIVTVPKRGDIETMTYDMVNDSIYFPLTGNHNLELYRLNPHTLEISLIVSTTTVDMGGKPAIVTDGTYIYGITNTNPSKVFKVKISDGMLTFSGSGHVPNGHSAAIGIYASSTELYFGGGISDGFEKTDAATLRTRGILDLGPCAISNDTPYAPLDETSGYVYIPCEIVPHGYRVHTSDLSVTQFGLPGLSFGMFIYGSDLFSAARDGSLDVFPQQDMTNIKRYYVLDEITPEISSGQNFELNELFYSTSTDSMYFTAWWGIPGLYQVSTTTVSRTYKDATYDIDDEPIPLTDGVFHGDLDPQTGSMNVIRSLDYQAMGDINSDGKPDVAFIITQDTGGTGLFYYGVAALRTNNGYIGTNAVYLGDRIAPQKISISNGKVTINFNERRKDESMTVTPSVHTAKVLKISEGRLLETK